MSSGHPPARTSNTIAPNGSLRKTNVATAILLVSADFLASDFIVNNELPPLLIKADSNGLRILPVILKPCGFLRDPVLSTFQCANDPASPLLGMSTIDQEGVYDKIAEEVAIAISNRRVLLESGS